VSSNIDFPVYKLEEISKMDDDEVDLEKVMNEFGLGMGNNM
jgi:hypothetical protein